MTSRLEHSLYQEDLERSLQGLDLSSLDGARIMLSGATGMVGAALIDALAYAAQTSKFSCQIIALGRNEAKARERLPYFGSSADATRNADTTGITTGANVDMPKGTTMVAGAGITSGFSFVFEELDISQTGAIPQNPADIIVHLASTTHPRAYATQPIGTINANLNGLQSLLNHAAKPEHSRFVFASSVEVYGENRGDTERFDESYTGQLDCNTLRAGYPEAKRLGEALCQAYAAEKQQEVYIPRLPRIFGPTVLSTDTKAISQFIAKAVAGEDIVLKSEGTQLYSYLYVADVVRALLWMLTHELSTSAYNFAYPSCDATLKSLATKLAHAGGSNVVFELPDEVERAGYSTATQAIMDGSKFAATGWEPLYSLDEALERTVTILRDLVND